MKVIEQKGMYPRFPRSGKDTRVTHYCPGCGHGIVNKLIAECCAEMGLQDETIFVDPVGCGDGCLPGAAQCRDDRLSG